MVESIKLRKLNNPVLLYAIGVLLIIVVGYFVYRAATDTTPLPEDKLSSVIRQLTPQEAQDALEQNDRLILIDVRSQREWETKPHIDGAQLIPMSEFQERALTEIDPDTPILLTCEFGNIRSMQAAQYLIDNGYTQVYNLDGGLQEWKRANLPLEPAAGS